MIVRATEDLKLNAKRVQIAQRESFAVSNWRSLRHFRIQSLVVVVINFYPDREGKISQSEIREIFNFFKFDV